MDSIRHSSLGSLSGDLASPYATHADGHLPLLQHQQSDDDPALHRPGGFFPEKVVFPFEDWLFRCPPHSRVIWTHGLKGAD